MRETIKYVDADHKFGKTIIYTGYTEDTFYLFSKEYVPN